MDSKDIFLEQVSRRRSIGSWLTRNQFDSVLAKAGIALSVLLLGTRLIADQVFLLVIPLALAVGCLLFLHIRMEAPTENERLVAPRLATGFLPSVVFVGLAAMVLVVHSSGQRTLTAFGLTAAVGGVILAQIAFTDESQLNPSIVLAEILLMGILVRLTTLFVTPGFIGVDIWTHVPIYIEGIVQSGSLATIATTKYVMAPFYHVLGAIGALVMGTARSGVYLTLGLLVPLSALFVYVTALRFAPARWALFGTALYVLSDQFIRWGIHLIPTSLGLVFFLGALYSLTVVFDRDGPGWPVWTLVIFSLAVVFTHQVSTAVLLVPLGIAPVASAILDSVETRSAAFRSSRTTRVLAVVFVFVLAVTVASWSVTPFGSGTTFFFDRLEVLRAALRDASFLDLAGSGTAPAAAGAGTSTIAALSPYIDVLGFMLLFAGSVLGGFAMLRWVRPSDSVLTIVGTAAVIFVLVFGLSIFGVRVFLPGRWMAFMYVPFVAMGAVALGHLSRRGSKRILLLVILVVLAGYPTSMAVAEKASMDSPVLDETHSRYAYSETEIAALETIRAIRPPAQFPDVRTDHPYRTIFESPGGYDSATLVVEGDRVSSSTAVVYRDYQTTGRVLFKRADGSTFPAQFDRDHLCRPTWNHLYTNGDVRLCDPVRGSGG